MRVDMDTLTSYEEKIKKTNILFKVPPDFYLCKRDSIKISDVTFSYLMNVFNQNPGILQSKDQEMIVFLYGPRLFVNSSGYDWKRYARHIDNLAYHDFMPRIKKYPSKIAKKLFNADSLFVWERMPKGTENVFVIDTVDLGRKFVERLDWNYRIQSIDNHEYQDIDIVLLKHFIKRLPWALKEEGLLLINKIEYVKCFVGGDQLDIWYDNLWWSILYDVPVVEELSLSDIEPYMDKKIQDSFYDEMTVNNKLSAVGLWIMNKNLL